MSAELVCFANGYDWDLADWVNETPSHKLIHYLTERDGFTCAYCGDPVTCLCRPTEYAGIPAATVDHRIARLFGGGDDLDNLVIACRPCNSRKGSRHPSVMLA